MSRALSLNLDLPATPGLFYVVERVSFPIHPAFSEPSDQIEWIKAAVTTQDADVQQLESFYLAQGCAPLGWHRVAYRDVESVKMVCLTRAGAEAWIEKEGMATWDIEFRSGFTPEMTTLYTALKQDTPPAITMPEQMRVGNRVCNQEFLLACTHWMQNQSTVELAFTQRDLAAFIMREIAVRYGVQAGAEIHEDARRVSQRLMRHFSQNKCITVGEKRRWFWSAGIIF